MFKDLTFDEYSSQLLKQLPKGAFLTVKEGERLNTMTIGWGSLGFIWRKPIFTVLVRYSRYTYELLDKAKEFSVSVPLKGELKKELALCGTKSGRDIDKFKECGFTPLKGKVINTPVIAECDLHYECKVVHQQAMEPALFDPALKGNCYPHLDYHVIYYGEIIATYLKE